MKRLLMTCAGLSLALLLAGFVSGNSETDPPNVTEAALKTMQDKSFPFSYRMTCRAKGCTTREGRFYFYYQIVESFPNTFDALTRQDYFCWKGLCYDGLLSPAGRDGLYDPSEDALGQYPIFIVGMHMGRPAINVKDCDETACYVNGDVEKPIPIWLVMDQIPTLWDDEGNYDCRHGVCTDPDGWVVGVRQSSRLSLSD